MSDLPPVTDQELKIYREWLAHIDAIDPQHEGEAVTQWQNLEGWMFSNRFVERLLAERKRERELLQEAMLLLDDFILVHRWPYAHPGCRTLRLIRDELEPRWRGGLSEPGE